MHPGPDSMGHNGPPSFTARRPNASNLPNFELPPPPLQHGHQKYPFGTVTSSLPSPVPSSFASHGNLPTPPSNNATEGISPNPSTTAATSQGIPYTPGPNGYAWPSHQQQGGAPYGFQPTGNPQYQSQPPRGQPSSQYVQYNLPPFPASTGSMAAPTPRAMTSQDQQQQAMMSSHTPVSSAPPHPSPVHSQDGFRPPPTPSYHASQPASASYQQNYPYSSGPSPTHQSPPLASGGQHPRMSPGISGPGPAPSMPASTLQSPQHYGRPFGQYSLPGPVLSNVSNPNGQPMIVNGMPPGVIPTFNSGHAAHLQHMYHGPPHPGTQQVPNDRPFKCDQCPQSFNRNHDLKRHKRIHLAVKPFPCGHCDKSFSRKDALKRHILVKGCGKAVAAAAAEAAAAAACRDKDSRSRSPNGDHESSSSAAENGDSKPTMR